MTLDLEFPQRTQKMKPKQGFKSSPQAFGLQLKAPVPPKAPYPLASSGADPTPTSSHCLQKAAFSAKATPYR